MKLHFAPKTCALASQITLEEAGADYELVPVDIANGKQRSPEYLAINPLGRIPTLELDGMYLTETPAILTYIGQVFPDAGLVPDKAVDFARLQSFNSYMCSTVHIAHLHRMRGHRWVDDEAAIESMQRKVPETMRTCFEMIESHWFQGPWVLGSRYSVCDPYLFTVSGWLEGDGVDIRSFPRVNDHFQRTRERPSVKRALERAGKATL